MRRPALPLALALSLLLAPLAADPVQAAEALWKDSPGATPPPDIARLNDFMHELAERKIAGGDKAWRKHRAMEIPFGL